jgi:hypothetical protein
VTALQARKVGLRSLQESIDTTTSGGKLIFHVFGDRDGAATSIADDRVRIPYSRSQAGVPLLVGCAKRTIS